MDQAQLEMHLKEIEGPGFTIIENVIPPDLVKALKDRICARSPHVKQPQPGELTPDLIGSTHFF